MWAQFRKALYALPLIWLAFYIYHRYPQHLDPAPIVSQDHLVMGLVSPLTKGVTLVSDQLHRAGKYFTLLSTALKENERLQEDLQKLELQNRDLQEDSQELTRLRELVGFEKKIPKKLIPARVISYPPLASYRMLMIDKGSRDGVLRRASVLVPDGLVGQVMRVTDGTAEVLLITDPTSAVDARVDRTGARGLIVGKSISIGFGRDLFIGTFEYLNRTVEVAVGDVIKSTGLDGVYPEGLEIGTINAVKKDPFGLFQGADLTPRVDFNKLREVLVLDTR